MYDTEAQNAGRRYKYRLRKEFLDRYKTLRGCVHCRETYAECLDFHHLDDKNFSVGRGKMLPTSQLVKEVALCIILCTNCHRKLHGEQWELTPLECQRPTEEEVFEAYCGICEQLAIEEMRRQLEDTGMAVVDFMDDEIITHGIQFRRDQRTARRRATIANRA